jgi:hypothetical protein
LAEGSSLFRYIGGFSLPTAIDVTTARTIATKVRRSAALGHQRRTAAANVLGCTFLNAVLDFDENIDRADSVEG